MFVKELVDMGVCFKCVFQIICHIKYCKYLLYLMENITTVYVINLKKDAERRARMEGNLSQAGIHATFVQGIYGKDLTIKEREETCTPFCAKFCTPGAI